MAEHRQPSGESLLEGSDALRLGSPVQLQPCSGLAAPPQLPSTELKHLCEQLHSNLDEALQRHYSELQRQWHCLQGMPSPLCQQPFAGLSQQELDALATGATNEVDVAVPSRCSSAKPEPTSAAHSPKTRALFQSKCMKDVVKDLATLEISDDASENSDVTISTRSSSSPSHLRGLSIDPLSSPRSQDAGFCNSEEKSPPPPDVNPPGTIASPTALKLPSSCDIQSPSGRVNLEDLGSSPDRHPSQLQASFSPGMIVSRAAPNLRSPCKLLSSQFDMHSRSSSKSHHSEAAGVALPDSPLKCVGSPGLHELVLPAGDWKLNAPPSSWHKVASMKTNTSLALGRSGKKSVTFAPLSKRKLAVMEAQQSRLQRMIKSHYYELVSAAFIIFNVVFITLETDSRAKLVANHASSEYGDFADSWDKIYSFIAANLFSAVFVLDLMLRIYSEKEQFFLSKCRGWNMFDIVVVFTSVVEVIVHWYEIFSDTSSVARAFLRKFSMLRIIRLLRVISHTRAVRVIRFIRELRLMVFSLTGTLKSLMWAIVLLCIILLVFGVFFTDGAVTYLIANPQLPTNSTSDLRERFGTLSGSTVSLYMAMSGGEDWGNLLTILKPLPFEYHGAFLAFITFAILALLNVVTAVFVEAAMQVSQNDKELVVLEEMQHKCDFASQMKQVFEELDTNDSGALSLEEFEKHIEDAKLTAFLASFDLDVSQVRTLFTLLDVDCTGEVDLQEFVQGCLRLKGGAKSLDMAILKYQIEWILHNIQSLDKKFGHWMDAGSDRSDNDSRRPSLEG